MPTNPLFNPGSILMAATHTHAAVRATHIGTGKLDDAYHQKLAHGISQAVLAAEKNLAPAQLGHGSFQKPRTDRLSSLSSAKPGTVDPNPFGIGGERIKSVSGRSNASDQTGWPGRPPILGPVATTYRRQSTGGAGQFQCPLLWRLSAWNGECRLLWPLCRSAWRPRWQRVKGIRPWSVSCPTGPVATRVLFAKMARSTNPSNGSRSQARMLADETIKTIATMKSPIGHYAAGCPHRVKPGRTEAG